MDSSSHYETNFGVCSAIDATNTKIGFLKGILRLPFKKPIFIMRIAGKISAILIMKKAMQKSV
jgi:hypothetical protein